MLCPINFVKTYFGKLSKEQLSEFRPKVVTLSIDSDHINFGPSKLRENDQINGF